MGVLKKLAVHCGIPARDVHSEMSSDYPSSVRKGILSTHGNGKVNPRLILSSMETLKNRMSHPLFVKFALSRVDSVSIDEVHLFNGVSGAQNAMLLRRLRQLCKMGKTTWVGASATIAFPKEHLGRLVGLTDDRKLALVMPDKEDVVHDGVVHHVFIRPRQMASVRSSFRHSTRAAVRAICATSIECVSRVRNMSPSWFTNTCVLYSSRRNAPQCTTRSRSR